VPLAPTADELDDDIDVVPLGELERVVDQRNALILLADDIETSRILVSDGRKPHGRTHSLVDDVGMLQ